METDRPAVDLGSVAARVLGTRVLSDGFEEISFRDATPTARLAHGQPSTWFSPSGCSIILNGGVVACTDYVLVVTDFPQVPRSRQFRQDSACSWLLCPPEPLVTVYSRYLRVNPLQRALHAMSHITNCS